MPTPNADELIILSEKLVRLLRSDAAGMPTWKSQVAALIKEIANFVGYDEIIDEVSDLSCPKAAGFEGPETFLDCGDCIVCYCKKLRNKE